MSEERVKYIVHRANIMDDEGNKRRDGEIVELTPKTARHYNKLGFLRPFFEDDEEEDEDDDDAATDTVGTKPTQLVRARRPTTQPPSA